MNTLIRTFMVQIPLGEGWARYQTSVWQSGLRQGLLPGVVGVEAIITRISTPRAGAYRGSIHGTRGGAPRR